MHKTQSMEEMGMIMESIAYVWSSREAEELAESAVDLEEDQDHQLADQISGSLSPVRFCFPFHVWQPMFCSKDLLRVGKPFSVECPSKAGVFVWWPTTLAMQPRSPGNLHSFHSGMFIWFKFGDLGGLEWAICWLNHPWNYLHLLNSAN